MEDSLKGILITATVILIFITCVLNFIVLFPQEQGVSFNDAQSSDAYLTIQSNSNPIDSAELNNLSTSTNNAFNQWDITQGFMGSNQMKQSQTGVGSSVTQVFRSITIVAKQLFGQNSPIVWIIGILTGLAGILLIYYIYKFVRTGL